VSDWEVIRRLIAERFVVNEDEIREETDLIHDLDAQSLDLYELVVAVEQEFPLERDEDDPLGSVKTAGDLLNMLSDTEKEIVE
jgi:acyl carrier protein